MNLVIDILIQNKPVLNEIETNLSEALEIYLNSMMENDSS